MCLQTEERRDRWDWGAWDREPFIIFFHLSFSMRERWKNIIIFELLGPVRTFFVPLYIYIYIYIYILEEQSVYIRKKQKNQKKSPNSTLCSLMYEINFYCCVFIIFWCTHIHGSALPEKACPASVSTTRGRATGKQLVGNLGPWSSLALPIMHNS